MSKKIVGKSNFDNDTINDVLVAANVDDFFAEKIVALMNDKLVSDNSTYYFHVENEDYILHVWEP